MLDHIMSWLKCITCGYTKLKAPMISLEMYYKGRDKEYPKDLTPEIEANAKKLLEKVNAVLHELNVTIIAVSSGWRPETLNAKVGGAKKSNHITGCAIDLSDPHGELDDKFMKNLKVLEKHGLYLEHPDATKGWSHLQNVAPKSGNRVFKP